VFDPEDRRIDGGSGTDTILFDGAGEHLDLTTVLPHVYTGIEAFDLTGTGDNTLAFTLRDVLNLSDTTNGLFVKGNAGDTVTSTGQGWVAGSDETVAGTLYHTYASGAASLHVQAGVDVILR
jgi:hypothetical protein